MGLHPNVRPLRLILGILGSIQGIVWTIFSIVGIVCYAVKFENTSLSSYTEILFGFIRTILYSDAIVFNSIFVIILLSVYFLLSLAWICVSIILIVTKKEIWSNIKNILLAWSILVIIITCWDIVCIGYLGYNFQRFTDSYTSNNPQIPKETFIQIHSINVVMVVFGRGFFLILLNIYLSCITLKFIFSDVIMESPIYDKMSKSALTLNEQDSHRLDFNEGQNSAMTFQKPETNYAMIRRPGAKSPASVRSYGGLSGHNIALKRPVLKTDSYYS